MQISKSNNLLSQAAELKNIGPEDETPDRGHETRNNTKMSANLKGSLDFLASPNYTKQAPNYQSKEFRRFTQDWEISNE